MDQKNDTVVRPVTNEIATILDGKDITQAYVGPLLINQDAILQRKTSSMLTGYEELLRDDQVASAFQQRRLALTSSDWVILPGDTDRASKKAAIFLQDQLLSIDFTRIIDQMLYGVFYGYAVGECLWRRVENQISLENIKVRKQVRFAFGSDQKLRLLTTEHPLGEELPERKFWTFATGSDHGDNPYGRGLAHFLYWPVWFKKGGIDAWMTFLDKFGMPTVKGIYPLSASDQEKAKLLDAMRSIQSVSAISMPEGMDVQLLEAARSGQPGYGELLSQMNDAISKIILSQTLTTDAAGGQYKAEAHMNVRDEIVKADANLIESSFNRSVAQWLTDWNFPGAKYPKLSFKTESEPDLNAQASRDKILFEIGFQPSLKYVTDTYGGEWSEKSVKSDNSQSVVQKTDNLTPAVSFSEKKSVISPYPSQDRIDEINLDKEFQGAIKDLIAPLFKKIKDGTPPSELQRFLVDAYPMLDDKAFENLLAKSIFVADVWGRLNAEQQPKS